ncbi:MAG: DNAase [Proteobacteria bacterium]|nr:DNAase [Pseudomonadota bacterium]
MFIDSHCHINFPDLISDLDGVIQRMSDANVEKALCVSVSTTTLPEIIKITNSYLNIYGSAGVHPNEKEAQEPTLETLVNLSANEKIIAIGETGLDYFRSEGDMSWQQERFRRHIRCAKEVGKPLIVHTREAPQDTIRIMKEEGASQAGGVMHCFTESYEMAEAAINMGFMISFSGIVTFKNATQVKEVAAKVPLNSILIETDSPYLAPVPFRGKTNEPSFVKYVAEELANLKNVEIDLIASQTTDNFHRLFKV